MTIIDRLLRRLGRLLLGDLHRRMDQVEYNAFNRRFYAVEQAAEYLVGAQVPGDYFEFGVYQGRTFAHACKLMGPLFPGIRFVACDSFEGLPPPKGLDAKEGYSSHFYQGQFRCTKEAFVANLGREGVDLARVVTIEGWYDRSLTDRARADRGLQKIACAWIDCDLYESTVPVLKFITPMLSVGSVLLFDDWRCFRNHPDYGQQRATREWLAANPAIKLAELLSFGWNGLAFTVLEC